MQSGSIDMTSFCLNTLPRRVHAEAPLQKNCVVMYRNWSGRIFCIFLFKSIPGITLQAQAIFIKKNKHYEKENFICSQPAFWIDVH